MAADEQSLLRADEKCVCGIRNLQERVATHTSACNRADTIKVEPIVEAVEIVPDTTAIIETVIPEVGMDTQTARQDQRHRLGNGHCQCRSGNRLGKALVVHFARLLFGLGLFQDHHQVQNISAYSPSSAIGCRKTTMVSLQEHISDWLITISPLTVITAIRTTIVKHPPSVVV